MSKTRKSDRENAKATTTASAMELDESELDRTAAGFLYNKIDMEYVKAPQPNPELSTSFEAWPCKWRP